MNSSNILLNKRIFFKNQGKSEEFLMYPDFFYTVSRKSEIVPSLTGESEIVYAVSAKFEVANKPPTSTRTWTSQAAKPSERLTVSG